MLYKKVIKCTPGSFHYTGQVGPGKGRFLGKDDSCESALAINQYQCSMVSIHARLNTFDGFLKTKKLLQLQLYSSCRVVVVQYYKLTFLKTKKLLYLYSCRNVVVIVVVLVQYCKLTFLKISDRIFSRRAVCGPCWAVSLSLGSFLFCFNSHFKAHSASWRAT